MSLCEKSNKSRWKANIWETVSTVRWTIVQLYDQRQSYHTERKTDLTSCSGIVNIDTSQLTKKPVPIICYTTHTLITLPWLVTSWNYDSHMQDHCTAYSQNNFYFKIFHRLRSYEKLRLTSNPQFFLDVWQLLKWGWSKASITKI